MTENGIKFIIERILDNAQDTWQEAVEDNDSAEAANFYSGKKLAYYEVLDTIKNTLIMLDEDLKEFGLDIDLDKTFV